MNKKGEGSGWAIICMILVLMIVFLIFMAEHFDNAYQEEKKKNECLESIHNITEIKTELMCLKSCLITIDNIVITDSNGDILDAKISGNCLEGCS